MAYLITPSLYGSYSYYAKTDFRTPACKEQAKQSFLDTLNKIYSGTSEAAQRGIDFENEVLKITQSIKSNDPCAIEVALKVAGGVWQEKVSKRVDNYLLYGKVDVIKQDTIYDIKRVSKYDLNKYESSIQHLLYMECTGLEHFKYLICDGSDVFEEYYHKDPNNLEKLLGRTNEMVNFINSASEFKEPFNKNWIAKGE